MIEPGSANRRVWLALLAACAGAALLALVLPAATPRGPISVNAGEDGARAAFLYLQRRGWDLRTWRRPLAELPLSEGGVLIISVPAGAPYAQADTDMLRRWLMVGGDIVVLLDPNQDAWRDRGVLDELDITRAKTAREAAPGALMDTLVGEVTLQPGPDDDWHVDGPVQMRAGVYASRPDPDDLRLAVNAAGDAAIIERTLHQGRVVVIEDRALLANAWFARAGTGNAALVEHVLDRLDADRGVLLDEYHWGLREAVTDDAVVANRRSLDLLLAHLMLVYVLVAWTLGRRFGPARAPTPPPRTSVERDLAALGALHARAEHSAELGHVLVDAVARTTPPAAFAAADLAGDLDGSPASFLALARRIGTLQRDGRL